MVETLSKSSSHCSNSAKGATTGKAFTIILNALEASKQAVLSTFSTRT